MTPLAHRLAKVLTLPPRQRGSWSSKQHSDTLRECLTDIHCFEVSAVKDIIQEFGRKIAKSSARNSVNELFGRYFFLPAPKTWIEYRETRDEFPYRVGHLLEEKDKIFKLFMFTEENVISDNNERSFHYLGEFSLVPKVYFAQNADLPNTFKVEDYFMHTACMLAVTLIFINTPRVFGRRTVMPHLGLEKRLTRALGPGKFPLHAWTEIKLEITKPPHIDDGQLHEAHLTGRRALHFCRKHIRIRLGQLEYVSAHWRGDPAIGIKRSRYSVQP